MNEMKEVKKMMEKYVADYGMYQDYLEKVISETAQFESISQILTRYECLTEARKELSERQDQNLQALEDASTEMVIELVRCNCSKSTNKNISGSPDGRQGSEADKPEQQISGSSEQVRQSSEERAPLGIRGAKDKGNHGIEAP